MRARVVLLGASNLKLALPTLVAWLESAKRSPMDILVACGHGRSYGSSTRVLGVEMPSIGASGLWSALERGAPLPTLALLADVGNDIMYGASVDEISAWVARDIGRLRAAGAAPLVVRLPLVSIERLSAWRYGLVRSLLFPTRRITLDTVRRSARDLDLRLEDLARRHDLPLVEPAAHWYGFDPIHIRSGVRADVWGSIVARWIAGFEPGTRPELSAVDRRALARARPLESRVLGFARERAQPAARLASGTTISLF